MTRLATCPLCEANCGLEVEVEGGRVTAVRGDAADPLSRGHVCPKGAVLAELHQDPDRVRQPLRRVGDSWQPIGWEEALDLAADRLEAIRRAHGADAVGVYVGNPTVHDYGAILYLLLLREVLGTRNVYTANSVDTLPRLLVSYWLYGSQAALPVPDVDRTQLLLVLGANPVVSGGSVMTAPGFARRARALRERGGRLVVIDPRRTETAALADEHLFVRPGSDSYLLVSLLQVLFAEGRVNPRHLRPLLPEGALAEVEQRVLPWPPERTAAATGIAPDEVRRLARAFADSPSAVAYGRVGACTQTFGALTTYLIDLLNVVTGNLDRPGGAVFPAAAVDLPGLAGLLGQTGSFGRYRSRVSGLPEFSSELPVAALAEEIETPGAGQVRALVVHAGNPVLSTPNGRRLERALATLDFAVAIDPYLNETTRHAHLILPPAIGLERDHYPLIFGALSVHNTARYSAPAVDSPAGVRPGWQALLGLATRLLARRGLRGRALGRGARLLLGSGPERVLDLALRAGPYGLRRGRRGLSLAKLRAAPHGLDLGPIEPRLRKLLSTPDRRLALASPRLLDDLARLEARLEEAGAEGTLQLIGRRELRSNNSWMHNLPRLARGPERCTLLVHPRDAADRGLRDGARARLTGPAGSIEVPVTLSEDIMPGVVCLPHGWGHHRPGTRLSVAGERPGESLNDVLPSDAIDAVSGCSVLNGTRVRVEPARVEVEAATEVSS